MKNNIYCKTSSILYIYNYSLLSGGVIFAICSRVCVTLSQPHIAPSQLKNIKQTRHTTFFSVHGIDKNMQTTAVTPPPHTKLFINAIKFGEAFLP